LLERRIKILLVNQFFFPEVAAVAQLMTDLAEDLSDKGIHVSVLCGRVKYSRKQDSYSESDQLSAGVKVHRVPALNIPGRSGFVRAVNYLSFHLAALLRTVFLPRSDCVVVFTNPPLIGIVGWLLKRLRGARFIQVTEDLYPDVAVELGFLRRDSFLTRVAERLSAFLLRHSDHVIALGEAMKDVLVSKGAERGRVSIIPNWADGSKIFPIERTSNLFLDRHGLQGKFVVEYSGHMGEAHDFMTILEAAKRLTSDESIVFLLIGDGPRKPEITAFTQKHNLNNVLILPYQDRSALPFTLSAADIALISLKPGLEPFMFPCKLYGIMAAGRPFIYIGSPQGEISHVGNEAGCGITVPVGEVDQLVESILKIKQNDELRQKMGQNAREYFLENFERKIATDKYYALLQRIAWNA